MPTSGPYSHSAMMPTPIVVRVPSTDSTRPLGSSASSAERACHCRRAESTSHSVASTVSTFFDSPPRQSASNSAASRSGPGGATTAGDRDVLVVEQRIERDAVRDPEAIPPDPPGEGTGPGVLGGPMLHACQDLGRGVAVRQPAGVHDAMRESQGSGDLAPDAHIVAAVVLGGRDGRHGCARIAQQDAQEPRVVAAGERQGRRCVPETARPPLASASSTAPASPAPATGPAARPTAGPSVRRVSPPVGSSRTSVRAPRSRRMPANGVRSAMGMVSTMVHAQASQSMASSPGSSDSRGSMRLANQRPSASWRWKTSRVPWAPAWSIARSSSSTRPAASTATARGLPVRPDAGWRSPNAQARAADRARRAVGGQRLRREEQQVRSLVHRHEAGHRGVESAQALRVGSTEHATDERASHVAHQRDATGPGIRTARPPPGAAGGRRLSRSGRLAHHEPDRQPHRGVGRGAGRLLIRRAPSAAGRPPRRRGPGCPAPTVVSDGSANPARSMSSKPTTLTSRGTTRPLARTARRAPKRHDVVVAEDAGHARVRREQARRRVALPLATLLEQQSSSTTAAPQPRRARAAHRPAVPPPRDRRARPSPCPAADGRGRGGAPRPSGHPPRCRSSRPVADRSWASLLTSTVGSRACAIQRALRWVRPLDATITPSTRRASSSSRNAPSRSGIVGAVAQQHDVATLAGAVLDGPHQLREVGVLDVGDEQAQGMGRAQLQSIAPRSTADSPASGRRPGRVPGCPPGRGSDPRARG